MTIQSPTHRLRLFLLSLSLFCFGGLVQSQSTAPKPPPPDLEVVSFRWKMTINQNSPPGVPDNPVESVPSGGKSSSTIFPSNERPVRDPTPQSAAQKPHDSTYCVYSAQLANHGRKKIKSVAWDYVFSDLNTHVELKRQLGFNADGIGPNQKRTVEIRTPSSPPKIINARAAASPFEERIIVQCILFADGTLWANPDATPDLCKKMETFKADARTGLRPY